MTRTMLTVYAAMDAWLVRLAEGWRFCEGWGPFVLSNLPPPHGENSVLMFRWEQRKERVAYRGIGEWDHR